MQGSTARDIHAVRFAKCSSTVRAIPGMGSGVSPIPLRFRILPCQRVHCGKIDLEGKRVGDPWTAPKDDIREAGQWQLFAPRCGTLAHSVVAGNCQIISTVRSTNISKLYAYIMTTPINEVRAVGVWNVIVAFHRCVHLGRATEALAETAGGVLRHTEMKWKGCHPRNVRQLI